jgi:serine/threonine protein kinase
MAFNYLRRKNPDPDQIRERRIEPRMATPAHIAPSAVFDTGVKTIVDLPHVKVERLDTYPVLFSKVFKEFKDRRGQKYDYRYWAERENYFLREFLKKQSQFTHVVQARHLISENEAAKQVLTCDAGITIANWLRVKARYADTTTLSHPFVRSDAFLHLIRACLVALLQIHEHRIVHCDIKEDNICIPYTPNPFPGTGSEIHMEFDKLKLIDFAFSVAHAIPLTQILVINPDERVPYQSDLLIEALRADRRSGSPNAVQQLDYRVDLFSLGYMAEKISALGLDCPAGGDTQTLTHVNRLVQTLKAFDTAPNAGPLPHRDLIAQIDRLLVETAGHSRSLGFQVDGEWTAQELSLEQGAGRNTPMTPVALPLPTPAALPVPGVPNRAGRMSRLRMSLLAGLALSVAAGGIVLSGNDEGLAPQPASGVAVAKAEPPPMPPPPPILSLLRSDEDKVFQAGYRDLTQLMSSNKQVAMGMSATIEAEYAQALASPGPREKRSLALRRFIWMAKAGNSGSAQQVAEFEKNYDEVKQQVAKSAWWLRGQGEAPAGAARWMENGELLAENGDRPAMLDQAFAMGHGRSIARDRGKSVETYLKVIARSGGDDANSTRIRRSALRGLAATLDSIVGQKDQDAARRLMPALEARANAGAPDMQFYMGLMSECVALPANLNAARQWYRKAAADPSWKRVADQRARVVGRQCPQT